MCLGYTCLFLNSTLWQRMLNQVFATCFKENSRKNAKSENHHVWRACYVLGSHMSFLILKHPFTVSITKTPCFRWMIQSCNSFNGFPTTTLTRIIVIEYFPFLFCQVFHVPTSEILELHKFSLLSFGRDSSYCYIPLCYDVCKCVFEMRFKCCWEDDSG